MVTPNKLNDVTFSIRSFSTNYTLSHEVGLKSQPTSLAVKATVPKLKKGKV